MGGIAAIINWDDPVPAAELVERLLDRVPHRGTDGRAFLAEPYCCFGFARHASTAREGLEVQPLSDPRRRLSIVADARLDNRDELHDWLGYARSPGRTEPELLLLGYERWGAELASHLIGEFAFVIWDGARRELYAVRDPFGVRPLHFHATPQRLTLASEVEQILVMPEVAHDVDERRVLDYLLHTHRHHRKTFFRDVHRLAPGHFILAGAGVVREHRYWRPPQAELRFRHPEEPREELRRLLRLALEARLDSDRPIVAQLSGGLDSSAIACLCEDVYRRSDTDRPPLRLASAVYPGLDCDETPFIDAVANSVRFPSERYDGTAWDPEYEERFHVAHPWREAQPGIATGWRRVAQREGARVALCGVGGDELLVDDGVFQDLAARGWWRTLLRETGLAANFHFRGGTQRDWLKRAILGAWPPPRSLRRAYRRLRPRQPVPPPAWMGPRLQELWSEPALPEEEPVARVSATQQFGWQVLTSPLLCGDVDLLSYLAARRGIQLRFPFLDVRLAEYLLALPFEYRLPGGWSKRLLREALADLLPPEIARRQWKTEFSTPVRQTIERNLPRYRFLLSEGEWVSETYVARSGAQEHMKQLADGSVGAQAWMSWQTAWDIMMLEMWLRDLKNVQWPVASIGVPSRASVMANPGTTVNA